MLKFNKLGKQKQDMVNLGRVVFFSEQQWEPGVGVKDTQNNRGWG